MSKFVQKTYSNKKELLKFPDHYVAMAVTVDDTGVTANADGKKIVDAGTIMGSAGANKLADDATMKAAKTNTQGTNGTKAEGVLFYDVDVTYGPASGAIIMHGFVDTSKLPEAPCADAKAALKLVQFVD